MDLSAVLAGFVSWTYILILLGIVVVGLLYARGVRRIYRYDPAQRIHWWNYGAFAAGLVLVAAALHPEMDHLAHQWFWIHMVQNASLSLVASLLLVLGLPAWALGWPRSLLRVSSRWFLPPWVVALIYMVSFSVWQIPPIYDAALVHPLLYALELAMFLGTGLLLWSQVIAWRPGVRARVGLVLSMVYLILVGMYSNLLASLYMFSTVPFYPYYSHLHTAGGALVDQHLAGAAMDVPGVLLLWSALLWLLWLWLSADEKAGEAEVSPANPAARP